MLPDWLMELLLMVLYSRQGDKQEVLKKCLRNKVGGNQHQKYMCGNNVGNKGNSNNGSHQCPKQGTEEQTPGRQQPWAGRLLWLSYVRHREMEGSP